MGGAQGGPQGGMGSGMPGSTYGNFMSLSRPGSFQQSSGMGSFSMPAPTQAAYGSQGMRTAAPMFAPPAWTRDVYGTMMGAMDRGATHPMQQYDYLTSSLSRGSGQYGTNFGGGQGSLGYTPGPNMPTPGYSLQPAQTGGAEPKPGGEMGGIWQNEGNPGYGLQPPPLSQAPVVDGIWQNEGNPGYSLQPMGAKAQYGLAQQQNPLMGRDMRVF